MGSDSAHSRSGGWSSLGEAAVSTFNRRQLLWRSAVALGGITGAGLSDPRSVLASATAAPRPIPGGLSLKTGGFVASDGTKYHFDCDVRFMQGLYVGLDGRTHHGPFGFI